MAVAPLALTVAILAAPRVAQAGCSHRPGVGPTSPALAHFDHLARAGALTHAEPPAPPPPPPRCSGPSCSQTPAPAAPAPESAPRAWVEHPACLGAEAPIAEPRPSCRAPVDEPARPIRLGPAIFHPPRA